MEYLGTRDMPRMTQTRHEPHDAGGDPSLSEQDQIQAQAPIVWERIRACVKEKVADRNERLGQEVLLWTSVTQTVAIVRATAGKTHAIASYDPIKFNVGGTWISSGEPFTAKVINGSVCFCEGDSVPKAPEEIAEAMLASLRAYV